MCLCWCHDDENFADFSRHDDVKIFSLDLRNVRRCVNRDLMFLVFSLHVSIRFSVSEDERKLREKELKIHANRPKVKQNHENISHHQ